jgi:hypothetical protein
MLGEAVLQARTYLLRGDGGEVGIFEDAINDGDVLLDERFGEVV